MEYCRHKGSKNIFIKIDNTGYSCSDYYKKETGDIVNLNNNDMEEITFQEAFSDEIESIVKQYKEKAELFLEARNALIYKNSELLSSNNDLREEIEKFKNEKFFISNPTRNTSEKFTEKQYDFLLNLLKDHESELSEKINKHLGLQLNEAHEANNKLKKEIEKLKIERDQLVIDYDELENKKFDSDLIKVDVRIEASQNGNDWHYLAEKTGIVIESLGDIEIYKTEMITDKFIRVKLVSKTTDYEAINKDLLTNDEYALKAMNENLTKANDKLADLAIKFYLKSEGIKL